MKKVIKIAAATAISLSSITAISGCSNKSSITNKTIVKELNYKTFADEIKSYETINNNMNKFKFINKQTTPIMNMSIEGSSVINNDNTFLTSESFSYKLNDKIETYSASYDGNYLYINENDKSFKMNKNNIVSKYTPTLGNLTYFSKKVEMLKLLNDIEKINNMDKEVSKFKITKTTNKNTSIYKINYINPLELVENTSYEITYIDNSLISIVNKITTQDTLVEESFIKDNSLNISIDKNVYLVSDLDDAFINSFFGQDKIQNDLFKFTLKDTNSNGRVLSYTIDASNDSSSNATLNFTKDNNNYTLLKFNKDYYLSTNKGEYELFDLRNPKFKEFEFEYSELEGTAMSFPAVYLLSTLLNLNNGNNLISSYKAIKSTLTAIKIEVNGGFGKVNNKNPISTTYSIIYDGLNIDKIDILFKLDNETVIYNYINDPTINIVKPSNK